MPYRQVKPARSAPTNGKPRGGTALVTRGRDPRHFAALDLGTNNCRLLIARPQGDGFAVIDAFSRIVRLGEGLA
ncbi:Ppx/GppA family phosphatase, partial [Sphingomonas sp. TF3]